MTTAFVFFGTIILPWIFFGIYNFFELETSGGFFEDFEIQIKIALLGIATIGSLLTFFGTNKKGPLDKISVAWLVISSVIFLATVFSIWFIFSLRNGIGF